MYDSSEHSSTVCAAFDCVGETIYMSFLLSVPLSFLTWVLDHVCANVHANAQMQHTKTCRHACVRVCMLRCAHMSACERGAHMRAPECTVL